MTGPLAFQFAQVRDATDNRLRNTPQGLKLLAKRPDGGGAK